MTLTDTFAVGDAVRYTNRVTGQPHLGRVVAIDGDVVTIRYRIGPSAAMERSIHAAFIGERIEVPPTLREQFEALA